MSSSEFGFVISLKDIFVYFLRALSKSGVLNLVWICEVWLLEEGACLTVSDYIWQLIFCFRCRFHFVLLMDVHVLHELTDCIVVFTCNWVSYSKVASHRIDLGICKLRKHLTLASFEMSSWFLSWIVMVSLLRRYTDRTLAFHLPLLHVVLKSLNAGFMLEVASVALIAKVFAMWPDWICISYLLQLVC